VGRKSSGLGRYSILEPELSKILSDTPVVVERMKKDYPSQTGPRLCFVGSMLGRNPGYITTQSQILSDLFKDVGYQVISVSAKLNPYLRLAEVVSTLIRRRREIDILMLDIYSGRSFVLEDIASWLGRRFGHRIVMVLHGGAMPEFMARHPKWTRRVLDRADLIVAPSPYLARAIAPLGYQAHIIPNVIDLCEYSYQHRRKLRPRLFWMRSFHPIYNPEMAIRVLARLRQEIPEATLVMAGTDKGLAQEIRERADDLGLNGAVRFVGFLDMAGKAREGSTSDIFINTNRIDNTPVTVLEACAMGLPVVCTNVGGLADLLKHEETGLLVSDDDDEAMAEAIRRLIDDPKLAEHLSANGRRLAERFAWEKVKSQWEQVFAKLMEKSTQ
jgi:glycosyltransferase involved in cell wall biosynthesis